MKSKLEGTPASSPLFKQIMDEEAMIREAQLREENALEKRME